MMNKVELCGVNTSKLPLLREDEKEELFRIHSAQFHLIHHSK